MSRLIKVLMIDDHPIILDGYKKVLSLFIILFAFGCSEEKVSIQDNTYLVKLKKYSDYKQDFFENQIHRDSIKVKILNFEDDTLKNNLLFDISYYYYKADDSLNFRFWNTKTKELSIKLKDTNKIAEYHWDLAAFFYHRNVYDSSYYNYNKAYQFYEISGNSFTAGRMLLNLATIQTNIKDYVGSEITTINAIKKFTKPQKHKQLYSSYNNLGIVNNELEEYDKALDFHQKALSYENEFVDDILKATSFNNIGVVYRNMAQYELSTHYYKKALKIGGLYHKNTRLYAMLLDNLAFSRFKLNDTIDIEEDFLKALKIRDSIDHKNGIIVNQLHLGEYYLHKQDTLKALNQIHSAKALSEEFHSYGDLLESLLILARLESENSNKYHSDYIRLSDSLQKEERKIRNKFARIRFETDEFIAENEVLNKKNFWIITASACILILLLLLYIIKHERNKNQKLSHIQKQQLANEEIYNLLIASQNKLDEGREREKKRISKELHDGILSKFFGIRLNLELLNNSINKESITEREKYIHELKKLENEIRIVSHQLSDNIFSSENSFKTIIKELLNSQKDLGSFQFKLKADEKVFWEEISSKIKINIYRIIQEALHNIIKYSKASRVEINFSKDKNDLKVEVKDDGIGFNINKMSEGIGHRNMRSRISDLEGEIQIKSSNSGTEIIMYIPI